MGDVQGFLEAITFLTQFIEFEDFVFLTNKVDPSMEITTATSNPLN